MRTVVGKPRLCPSHGIPMRRAGRLGSKLCSRCGEYPISKRNVSGLCVRCQVELHLQAASALPKDQESWVCPACAGEATSHRKAAASRRNGKLGGPPMSKRLCRLCHRKRLSVRNQSGVCRDCQRSHGMPVSPRALHKKALA